MKLFHITTREAWAQAQRDGVYRAPSLATAGFIHLSTEAQWPRTLERFFKTQVGLVLLTIEREKLEAELRFELADGDQFPHLYGGLNLSAVTAITSL